MNTQHIRAALKSAANLAEVHRQTGISVRRLFQLKALAPKEPFKVNLSTYSALDEWAKGQGKAKP